MSTNTVVETQYAKIEGHNIAYQDVGEGVPVFLLHGIPTNKFLWRNIIPSLSQTHRVIAPDLLNYGESDMPTDVDVSINAQCRIILKLMDALGIASAHVVAHDIGGGVAQLMAVNAPEKVSKLVLIDSVCFDSWPIPEFEPMLEPGFEESTSVEKFSGILEDFIPNGVYGDKVPVKEMIDLYITPWSNEKGKSAFFRNMRRLNKEYTQAIAGALHNLPHETLILWGDKDEFQKPKYAPMLADTIPDSSIKWIEGAAHWVTDEQPEAVSESLVAFL
ncbi:alpha/beta hydrolase [Alteromonas stellipolaris]|jgi:2-hydroxymuconate-semialdehyde hydrolase|uniref:alpha/beta fold hydrolase n=1 Tax=Alteromonas stellipolaris TaxID=233316 RepID=UPI0007B426D3|nr:alpha/beta hydrolase [Alteromonas stellipolaris]ANB24863.1 alpha/beta hydrolase [Alteromonas stellipolaris]MDO6540136.1 alpha/beta hydrolase [Alteromonas stellipolaris]